MKIGLISLFVKLGVKILPIFVKLLKGAKSLKAVLALASFGLWELFFSWQFAVLLMLTIFIHESGHVWAMRKMGMKTKGFYFVPLLGGAAVPDDMFPSRGAESYVAIIGPIWGGLMIIPVLILWYATGNPLWAGIIGWIAMINLFNLLPILPLDGGRILRSIAFSFSRKIGFVLVCAGMLFGAFITYKARLILFAFLFVFGGLEILLEVRGAKKVKKADEKFNFLRQVFPAAKFDEILLACDEEKMNSRIRKLFRALGRASWSVEDVGRIRQSLINVIWWDMWKAVAEEDDDYFSMNKKDKIVYQYHIALYILFWLDQEYDKKIYRMFQNPMNGRMAAYSAIAYCAVAGLLYYAMYLTQHIPGSQAALAIFQQ